MMVNIGELFFIYYMYIYILIMYMNSDAKISIHTIIYKMALLDIHD